MSGFAVEAACDVDVCCWCGTHPADAKLPPDRLLTATCRRARAAMSRVRAVSDVEAILGARVPILKLKLTLPVHLGSRVVPVDCCFNALNGVRNTELLRRLAAAEPRFRALARLVKLWAKRRDLVDASRHLFSSYAIVLLVASFLQQRDLLPRGVAFRALADEMGSFTPGVTDRSAAAWIDAAPHALEDPQSQQPLPEAVAAPRQAPPEVEAAVRRVVAEEPAAAGRGRRESVAELFAAFVAQHARRNACKPLVSVLWSGHDDAPPSRADKGWTSYECRHRYCLEDPLETHYDPARSLTFDTMRAIHLEFSRADRLLRSAHAAAGDAVGGAGGAPAERSDLAIVDVTDGHRAGPQPPSTSSGGMQCATPLLDELLGEIRIPSCKRACKEVLRLRESRHGDAADLIPPKDSSVEDYRLAVRQLWHRHPPGSSEQAEALADDDDDERGEEGEEEPCEREETESAGSPGVEAATRGVESATVT